LASKTRDELFFNLGIDVGTSSVKALLAAEDASEMRAASVPCGVNHPEPDCAEADPEAWWEAAAQAVDSLDCAGVLIRGIGVSTLYPALVLTDAAGRVLRPAILYCDQRSAAESRELLASFGEERARCVTGNAFPAGTASVTSLLWVRRHEPDIFARASGIGHAGTFIVEKLTGRRVIDFSSASLTGLYHLARNDWCDELLAFAGIRREMLPQVLPGGAPAGRLCTAAAQRLDLPAGLPVAAGAGDTVCSALGIGVAEPCELFVIAGSTNCFAALATAPDFDNGLINNCYLDPRTWIGIGATSTSGAAVQWFVDTFLSPGDYARFFDLCTRAQPGSGGVVFLPYLAGERTPCYDPRARGVFFGLTASTSLADLARSVAEGVCFADRHILESFETGGRGRSIESLLAAGGGMRADFMRRLRTDIIGKPIGFSGLTEVAALGAALLGGIAGGTYADWREAASIARKANRFTFLHPDPAAHAGYDAPYATYRQLYPRLKDLFAAVDHAS